MNAVSERVPYDDPVARTRLAWSRTLLVVLGVALLIGRGVVLSGRTWWLAPLAVLVVALMGLGLARMRTLAKRGRSVPAASRPWIAATCCVVAALATIAVVSCLT